MLSTPHWKVDIRLQRFIHGNPSLLQSLRLQLFFLPSPLQKVSTGLLHGDHTVRFPHLSSASQEGRQTREDTNISPTQPSASPVPGLSSTCGTVHMFWAQPTQKHTALPLENGDLMQDLPPSLARVSLEPRRLGCKTKGCIIDI